MNFNIGKHTLGPDQPTYFIADIAANHDGDLSRAYRLIELAKEAGADAAKFQNFQAKKIVSKEGFENLGGQLAHQSKWKKSVFDVYQDASLKMDWTPLLKEHCDKVGITYFTSPYDKESVDAVDPYVPAYKIGSGDINFIEILEYIAKKGKPMLVASGASTLPDVILAIETIQKAGQGKIPLCLMQCNTNYTGSLENLKYVNLNVLNLYKAMFPNVVLGLSDHTPGHATVLGAVALGARVIEKHFTDDNNRSGPDHPFSLNPTTWKEMVLRTRELEASLGDGIKRIEENELQSAVVQRRSMHFTKPVARGEIIRADTIEALRPAPVGSVTPEKAQFVIGTVAKRDYKVGDCLRWEDWSE